MPKLALIMVMVKGMMVMMMTMMTVVMVPMMTSLEACCQPFSQDSSIASDCVDRFRMRSLDSRFRF